MSSAKIILLLINIVGGVSVLGSYVYGLMTHPGQGNELWGAVPKALQPMYTLSMFSATFGYFLFFYHVTIKMNADKTLFMWGLSYRSLYGVFATILLFSALWMPLTFAWIADPSQELWIMVRVVLAMVGIASLALVVLFWNLKNTSPDQFWWPSVLGACLFFFQTGILDAIVWPALFR